MPQKNSIYQNRELSWLKFNERVLEEGANVNNPLMERLKFAAIFESNLDEFFMIRVGGLFDQKLIGQIDSKTGLNVQEQLDAVFFAVKKLMPKCDKIYSGIISELAQNGIENIDISKLSETEKKQLEKFFINEVLPLSSPQIIDATHPFPFLRNEGVYVGVSLLPKTEKNEKDQKKKFGIIPVALPLERIIHIEGKNKFSYVLIEDLIEFFAPKAFKKYRVAEKMIFRVTRNADINVNEALFDYDIDFREVMSDILKNRRKLAPVRLQIKGKSSPEIIKNLQKKLGIAENQIYVYKRTLDLSYIFQLIEKVKLLDKTQDLFYSELSGADFREEVHAKELFEYIRKNDLMFSYPFQSTKPFISMLKYAADDPDVVSIKITLYRVAPGSRVVSALIKAAENGKEVMVLVELRARFDEENNIGWSKQLEEAGATVIYGMPELKVHSKLLLITRKRGREIEYLTQIGTGNYNEETAKLYTDLSIFTSNKDIGAEASMVFNNLAIGELVEETNHLLVAPKCLRTRVAAMIDNEIAYAKDSKEAEIIIKCNSISDKTIIDKLIEASRAGVKIKLFVRGICCFYPGVAQQTENIIVKSIIGRFLEHSRIYIFGPRDRAKVYISSADFMTRNTLNRVEVATPVYDKQIQNQIYEIIEYLDKDNAKTKLLLPNGNYTKIPAKGEYFDSQAELFSAVKKTTEDLSGKILSFKPEKKKIAKNKRNWFIRLFTGVKYGKN